MKMLLTYQDIKSLTGISELTLKGFKVPKFRVKPVGQVKIGRAIRVFDVTVEDLRSFNNVSLMSKRGSPVKFSESRIDYSKAVFYSDDTKDTYIRDRSGKFTEFEGKMYHSNDKNLSLKKVGKVSRFFTQVDNPDVKKYIEVGMDDMYSRYHGWSIDLETVYHTDEYKQDVVEKNAEIRNKYNPAQVTIKTLVDEDFIKSELYKAWYEFHSSGSTKSEYEIDGCKVIFKK